MPAIDRRLRLPFENVDDRAVIGEHGIGATIGNEALVVENYVVLLRQLERSHLFPRARAVGDDDHDAHVGASAFPLICESGRARQAHSIDAEIDGSVR